MRPSAPHFVPWSTGFVLVLALLLALAVVAIEIDLVTFAYGRLGLGHRLAALLLFASLLGSAINIPIARQRDAAVSSGVVLRAYGVRYEIPVIEHWPGTVLAVNLGGAVIPTLLSAHLLSQVGHPLPMLAATLWVAAVTHRVARTEPGVGIVVPTLVPPLAAAAAAWVLAPEVRAAVAYVGGTMGTLIGADLLNLSRLRFVGAPVASIGGAGTFDGIFVTGIVAVLLA
jgi:uncharacterized membrane protein